MNDFNKAFDKFFDSCEKLIEDHYRNYSWNEELEWREGRKYRKINIVHDKGVRVWAFVNKENGDVLKPAGWKTPATNHARGNIFDKHGGMQHIKWTGPAYMGAITETIREEKEWEGWDDPSNYPDAELDEARVTRKDVEKFLRTEDTI